MAILKCPKCWREREEARSQPIGEVKVCGSCAMDIDPVIGFLAFYGYRLQKVEIEEDGSFLVAATGDETPPPPTSFKDDGLSMIKTPSIDPGPKAGRAKP